MKSGFKRIICVLVSLTLLLPSVALAVYGESEASVPTIFLDGINSSDTVNTDTGEVVYPPQFAGIFNAVKGAVLPLLGGLITDNYDKAVKPIADAVIEMFKDVSMTEDGLPELPTVSAFEYPSPEEIRLTAAKTEHADKSDYIYFSYDWRLDMNTLAAQFHDYIEYVLECTGASEVNVISFSMGTAVMMTYLHDYDYEYIRSFILLGGGFNGANSCGQSFSGRLNFTGEAFERYFTALTGNALGGRILDALLIALYENGTFDGLADIANNMTAQIMDYIYSNALAKTFARMPGMWALIPYEYYDDAKDLILADSGVSDEFIEKIDYYHNEIQANNKAILDAAEENGIPFYIVAKYGYTVPPVVQDGDAMGDGVIESKYESFGGTLADAGTTLGEDYVQAVDDGHDHLSPDGIVDASTCVFPERTWFIKNCWHDNNDLAVNTFLDYLLGAEEQLDVYSAEYPQFLIYSADDASLAPLTADNDSCVYSSAVKPDSFFAKLKGFFNFFVNFFKALFNI